MIVLPARDERRPSSPGFDLPGRWGTVAMLLGDALILGVIAGGCARASVHRKPGGAELVIVLAGRYSDGM